MTTEGLDAAVEKFHQAVREFAKGDPNPVKELFSHGEDVTLANPFGPAVRGWEQVSEALDFASSRFREGDVTSFETLAKYVTSDLAATYEVERWQAKVGERDDVASFDLRVTSVYRRDEAGWKLVHRHADPIATEHPDGPLRP